VEPRVDSLGRTIVFREDFRRHSLNAINARDLHSPFRAIQTSNRMKIEKVHGRLLGSCSRVDGNRHNARIYSSSSPYAPFC